MQTVEQRAFKWLFSEDTGLSSMSICAHMLGETYEGDAPSDVGDLGRCLRLLERIPEWKPRIKEMAQHGPAWAGLIGQWDHIVRLYQEEAGVKPAEGRRSPGTYLAMKLAIADGFRNDGRYKCGFAADGTLNWATLIEEPEDEDAVLES
jgi:hypothetical protein